MSQRRSRLLEGLKERAYDVLIVGGGITGAGVARDLAMRGLDVLLVEKGDFASGTSSKSGKLVHGGARYIKHLHFGLVSEACRERDLLANKVAPHLVRPIRFTLPFYRTSKTPRWLAALGLALYDLIALYRNTDRVRLVSSQSLQKQFPDLKGEDCVGGLTYWDCACLDFRLVIDTLKSAHRSGAHVVNYVELKAAERVGEEFHVSLRDILGNEALAARARTIVNTAGAWADDVLDRLGSRESFGLAVSAGIHLVITQDRLPITSTLALEVPRDGRMIYMVPWNGVILIGTTDDFYTGDKDRVPVKEEVVAYLLDAVNHYFPTARLTVDDVAGSFAGIRPLIAGSPKQSEDKLPRDDKVLVRDDGVVSVTGGKLTTFRAMAERVADTLVRRFFRKRPLSPCQTRNPIAGGEMPCPADASERIKTLWQRYGAEALAIERLMEKQPELASRVCDDAPLLWAEIEYFIDYEFAETVDDIVHRRWGGYLFKPGWSLPQRARERVEDRIQRESRAIS